MHQRRGSKRKWRGTPGVITTNPNEPQMPHYTQKTVSLHCLSVTRVSTQPTVAHVTGVWKGSRRQTSCVNLMGSMTLLLQLPRKRTCMLPLEARPESPVENSEKPQAPCQHWRRASDPGLSSGEDLGPGTRMERNPERPTQFAWKLPLS